MYSKLKKEEKIRQLQEQEQFLKNPKDVQLYQKIQLQQYKQQQENQKIFELYQQYIQKKQHDDWVINRYNPQISTHQLVIERIFGLNCFCFCFIRNICCLKKRVGVNDIDYSVGNAITDDYGGVFNSLLLFSLFLFAVQIMTGFQLGQGDILKGDENSWKGEYKLEDMLEKQKNGDYVTSQHFYVWHIAALGFSIVSIFISIAMLISLYFSNSRENKYTMHLWSRQFTWVGALTSTFIILSLFFTLTSHNFLSAITKPYYCYNEVTKMFDSNGNFYDSPQQQPIYRSSNKVRNNTRIACIFHIAKNDYTCFGQNWYKEIRNLRENNYEFIRRGYIRTI